MVVLIPFVCLSAAVLSDAATTRRRHPDRQLSVYQLQLLARQHRDGRQDAMVGIRVDLDRYTRAVEVWVLVQTRQVDLEAQAMALEEALKASGKVDAAERAAALRQNIAEQRRLLEDLASSIAHSAWLAEEGR